MEPEVTQLINPEVESLDELGVGRNELVLRFNEGLYKGRFLYVKTDTDGERIGSGNPDLYNTTTYIENAGLAEIHCIIYFSHELSEYFLMNASKQGTGTWLKLTSSNHSNRLIPHTLLKICDIDFSVSPGPDFHLDQIAPELISDSSKPFYTTLQDFLTLDTKSLQIPTLLKSQLNSDILKLKHLPNTTKSLAFVNESHSFTVHYNAVRIGSREDCQIRLPGETQECVKIQQSETGFFLIAENSSVAYRKLRQDEELLLQPGMLFNVGQIEFLASRFNVGRWSHIGKRPSMEDADVICHNLFIFEDLPLSYYAVYDGHGGSQCSQFLKSYLHETLKKTLLEHPQISTDVINVLKSSILSSFSMVDQMFANMFPDICDNVGSAAIICLVIGDRVITANLGDSRAVLSRKGKAIDLSVDHKPNSEKEYQRILANGGSVMLGRIDSKLAVSRAFGDFEFKAGRRGAFLSTEPDVTQIFIDPVEDEFLVIGCDGLFEAYKSQELVNIIRERLASMPETEQDPNRVIREVVNEAVFENRTNDNVTALLVTLSSKISL